MKDFISIFMPSRGRPLAMVRGVQSIIATLSTFDNFEILIGVDEDDAESIRATENLMAQYPYVAAYKMPRPANQYDLWNRLIPYAKGDIFVPFSDDQVFRTKDWDKQVRLAFDAIPDKIALLSLDDGSGFKSDTITTFILHRRVYETLGYFLPPFFSAYRTDQWMTDLFRAIDRVVVLPVILEHLHHSIGKSPFDKVYGDMERQSKVGDVYRKYKEMLPQRVADTQKLHKIIYGD